MTTTKQTTLKCNHCKKEASFVGERPELPGLYRIEGVSPPESPRNWYRIDPSYINSIWMSSDFVIGGDFCSPECMRDYIIEKIDEYDNPKPIMYGGLFSEVK